MNVVAIGQRWAYVNTGNYYTTNPIYYIVEITSLGKNFVYGNEWHIQNSKWTAGYNSSYTIDPRKSIKQQHNFWKLLQGQDVVK
jgi:hypothetical protein